MSSNVPGLGCFSNFTGNNSVDTNNVTEIHTRWETWVGIGATFLSAIAVSIGSIVQKLAHNINQNRPVGERSPQCKGILLNPLWLAGLALMILLQLPLSFAALTLAPQSLVIPLGAGSTIVFNQLFAPLILKEKLSRVEIFATVIILIGVILSTTAAGSGEGSVYRS
jgi:drug/metabolite transporter (DMT)-like permease